VAEARQKVAALDRVVKGPVLGARVVLIQEADPRIERPARAEGELNLAGTPVRAKVAAEGMSAAVDELAERLQRRLRDHVERIITREREPAASPAGEWRHGSLPSATPPRAFRPPEERELRRRKSFALAAMDAGEAALDLEALDHDFYLFHDQRSDTDLLLYRRDDGRLGLIAPAGIEADKLSGPVVERSRLSEPIELSTAKAEMDALNHRFLFFVNAETGRGNVIYLRQDGHYGLIEPS
jgi:ribosome-associated translation inhibitor RaiA